MWFQALYKSSRVVIPIIWVDVWHNGWRKENGHFLLAWPLGEARYKLSMSYKHKWDWFWIATQSWQSSCKPGFKQFDRILLCVGILPQNLQAKEL